MSVSEQTHEPNRKLGDHVGLESVSSTPLYVTGGISSKALGLCRERGLQYFWEAFPARDGLTTYMFAFADAAPGELLDLCEGDC